MLTMHSNGFIILCISLLTACASTPPPHFYTLESQSQPPVVTTTASVKKPLIGIGPLTLPALLDRSQIVTRAENTGAPAFFAKAEMGSVRFQQRKISWRLLPSAARVRPAPAAAHNFPSLRCAPLACANDLTPCRDGLAF
jgi:hypothetical protein